MFDLQQASEIGQFLRPCPIGRVSAQQRPDVGATSAGYRFELCDRLAATHDGVVLTAVFDTVEEIGELTSSVGSSDIRHAIRLSDSTWEVNPLATPINNTVHQRAFRKASEIGTSACGWSAGSVDVCPVVDIDDSNCAAAFIDLVDDAVGPDPHRVKTE